MTSEEAQAGLGLLMRALPDRFCRLLHDAERDEWLIECAGPMGSALLHDAREVAQTLADAAAPSVRPAGATRTAPSRSGPAGVDAADSELVARYFEAMGAGPRPPRRRR